MSHYVVTMLDFTPILELWNIAKVKELLFFFSADGNSLLTKNYASSLISVRLTIAPLFTLETARKESDKLPSIVLSTITDLLVLISVDTMPVNMI